MGPWEKKTSTLPQSSTTTLRLCDSATLHLHTMAMAMRWLGRPSARTAAFRSVARPSRPWTGRRNRHTAPTLDNHLALQQKGVPRLFTPQAFKLAYTEYEQLMVDELNECTAGTAPAGQRDDVQRLTAAVQASDMRRTT